MMRQWGGEDDEGVGGLSGGIKRRGSVRCRCNMMIMMLQQVHVCETPTAVTTETQVSRMKTAYMQTLDNLFTVNTDVGLTINRDNRNNCTFVKCEKAFKSLSLIPWSNVVGVEMSTTPKCVGIQSYMGQVGGQHVKMWPKQQIFDRKALTMAASLFATNARYGSRNCLL